MRLVLPDSPAYKDPHHRAAFFQQTLDELAALPGVRSATMVTGFPFSGLLNSGPFQVAGQPTEAGAQRFAVLKDISPNYFETMGALILDGRGFNDFDGPDTAQVALVSERLAKLYWPNESPLGHRLKVGGQDSLEPWLTIVGVVSDIKYAWSSRLPESAIYRPYQQAPQNYMAFGLRTKGDPSSLVSAAGFAVARVSSDQPIFEVKSLDRVIRENSLPIAYTAVMMAVAGGLALLLASVGVYAVMAYSVVERTHEIGVRMVVGARPGEIVRLILRRGVRLMLLGFAFGLPCAYGLAHLEANLLAGISAKDFWTFSWICSVMAAVSLLACYIPTRRAIRVDPIVALRYE
jgi:putative ABC transport system permease protein